MINQKVTLVLGAGASYPYGFPLGNVLMKQIIDQAIEPDHHKIGDKTLPSLLEPFGFSIDYVLEFGHQLKGAMQPSVDAFLFDRPEFIDIGKLAIAVNLIRHEAMRSLQEIGSSNESDSGKTKWYDYLLNYFLGTREEFKSNNLSIITFNYDRSFEYFFYCTLKPRFNLTEKEAADYVKSIPIVHVYGQLGKPLFFNPAGRDYTTDVDENNLRKSADEISLIYEKGNDDKFTENLYNAHQILGETKLLIFLGFGFHKTNLERLRLQEIYSGDRIVCTTYGRKPGERARDEELVRRYSRLPDPALLPLQMIDNHARGLLENYDYIK